MNLKQRIETVLSAWMDGELPATTAVEDFADLLEETLSILTDDEAEEE